MGKEENVIELEADKDLFSWAGFPDGAETYEKQIKEKFENNKNNVIEFPNQITEVSTSFVQGMFKAIVELFGKTRIMDYITIKASSKELENKIIDSILADGNI